MEVRLLKPAALLLFTCVFNFINAQPLQKTIDTKIEKATVFLNGAQINRSGKTSVNPGNTELIFKNISPYINKQSIQVSGEGDFTILSVLHKLNYIEEQTKQAELQKLQEQKETVQDKINTENDLLNIYTNEETLLSKNQAIVSQNNGLKTTDLKEAADFHRQRLTELKLKEAEIKKRLKKLYEDLAKMARQENELSKQATTATSEIVVTVQSKSVTEGLFKLNYFVDKAGWYPTYDIRVKDISNPVTLVYKANVFQSSGEDWKEVKLTLSTANPKQNGEKPGLPVWYLRYFTPQFYGANSSGPYNPNVRNVSGRVTDDKGTPLPYATIMVKGTKTGTTSDMNGNFSINIPYNASTISFSSAGFEARELFVSSGNMNVALAASNMSLSEVVVTSAYGVRRSEREDGGETEFKKQEKSIPLTVSERESTTSFSFDIETPYTILNDGKTSTVEMKTTEVPALYEYYCVPKLETDVFLTAKITDWSDLNLLEGESSIIFEGTYLGKALINPKTAGDTLSISLGRDKNIQVKRSSVREYSKKQLLGSNKVDYRSFEIVIRNNKKQPVKLVIEDQYPLSTMKEVEVDRIEHKEAELDAETGKLKWLVQLDSGKEKKIGFSYSVKYPKGNTIILD
ncbi:MAG: mucoidy inhibitor MuiA family protein [Ferruginibacter sp.]